MLRAEFVEEGGRAPFGLGWLYCRGCQVDEATEGRSEPHVEYESRRWVPAFNLALKCGVGHRVTVARALEVDEGREALVCLWAAPPRCSSGWQQGRVLMNGDVSRNLKN